MYFHTGRTRDYIVSTKLDQKLGGEKPEILADKNAQFLGLLTSLVKKIAKNDEGVVKRDGQSTTILRELRRAQDNRTTDRLPESILHPPSDRTEDHAVSSVAERHAMATARDATRDTRDPGRKGRATKPRHDDESMLSNEEGRSDYDEWGRTTTNKTPSHRMGYWSESSGEQDQWKRSRKKNKRRPPSRNMYAVARGRGGTAATGLYINVWDNINFLVSGYRKSRYKKVHSEREGVEFIQNYLRAKGMARPRWMKKGEAYYPSLSNIRRMLGMSSLSDDDTDVSYSGSDGSSNRNPPSKPTISSKVVEK